MRERAPVQTNRLHCCECGRVSRENERGRRLLEPLVLDEDCDRLALLMDDRCDLIARFELADDAPARRHREVVFDGEGSRLADGKPYAGALEITRQ